MIQDLLVQKQETLIMADQLSYCLHCWYFGDFVSLLMSFNSLRLNCLLAITLKTSWNLYPIQVWALVGPLQNINVISIQ